MERQRRGNAYGNIQVKGDSRNVIGDFNDSSDNSRIRSRRHSITDATNNLNNTVAGIHNSITRSPEPSTGLSVIPPASSTFRQPKRPIFVTNLQANFFRPINRGCATIRNVPEYVPTPTPADRRRNSETVLSLDRHTVYDMLIEAADHYPPIARRIAIAERATAVTRTLGDNNDDGDSDGDDGSQTKSETESDDSGDIGPIVSSESERTKWSAEDDEEDWNEEERPKLRILVKAWYRQKVVRGVLFSLRAAEQLTKVVLERL